MPYNPPDFYGPLRERRDTDVIYRGLADMGKGLASGINSATAYAGDMKKMDKQQAHSEAMFDKQLAGQSAMQNDRQGFEEMMFGKEQTAKKADKDQDAIYEAMTNMAKYDSMKTLASQLGVEIDWDAWDKLVADGSRQKVGAGLNSLDTLLKEKINEQSRNRPDKITEMPINNGKNVALMRNGQLFNILAGEKPTSELNDWETYGNDADGNPIVGYRYLQTPTGRQAFHRVDVTGGKSAAAAAPAPSKIEVQLKDGRKVTMTASEAARLGYIETPSSGPSGTPAPTSAFKSKFTQ